MSDVVSTEISPFGALRKPTAIALPSPYKKTVLKASCALACGRTCLLRYNFEKFKNQHKQLVPSLHPHCIVRTVDPLPQNAAEGLKFYAKYSLGLIALGRMDSPLHLRTNFNHTMRYKYWQYQQDFKKDFSKTGNRRSEPLPTPKIDMIFLTRTSTTNNQPDQNPQAHAFYRQRDPICEKKGTNMLYLIRPLRLSTKKTKTA